MIEGSTAGVALEAFGELDEPALRRESVADCLDKFQLKLRLINHRMMSVEEIASLTRVELKLRAELSRG